MQRLIASVSANLDSSNTCALIGFIFKHKEKTDIGVVWQFHCVGEGSETCSLQKIPVTSETVEDYRFHNVKTNKTTNTALLAVS